MSFSRIAPMILMTAAALALPGCGTSRSAAPKAAVSASITPEAYRDKPEYLWALDLNSGGRVVIQLRPDLAPQHVERITTLTRQGFYNGLTFHRVIDGFMAQGGDPVGNGSGGSPLPDVPAEFNGAPHVRGTVSMARSQNKDSANSQFYIMLMPRFSLDRNYTVFGRVVSGMAYVDAIQKGEPPVAPTRIVQASILADGKPMPPMRALTPPAATITPDALNAPLQR